MNILLFGKGGAGKSLLTVNFAVQALADEATAIVLDTDSQQTCSFWSDRRENDLPIVVATQQARLQKEIDKATDAGITYKFIDVEGGVRSTGITALQHADFVFIPTKIDGSDMDALLPIVSAVKLSQKPAAFIMTQIPPKADAALESAKSALASFEIEICPYVTYYRADYRHSQIRGLAVSEFNPKGKAAEEIKAIYKWAIEKVI